MVSEKWIMYSPGGEELSLALVRCRGHAVKAARVLSLLGFLYLAIVLASISSA